MAWQKQILHQIDSLAQKGVPGRIIVFGQNSEPILTGIGEEDVLVAAAEFGKGRIVCVAHNAYCENFQEDSGDLQKFHNNVKKWLTKGSFNSNANIINAKHGADQQMLSTVKIIFWDGGPGNILSADMEEFVCNGGGLFHCMTPWGWLQLNDGKSLSDVPYYSLLLDAGICYTDEYIQVQDNQFSVENNKASGAHILRLMKEIEQHPEKAKEKMIVSSRKTFLHGAGLWNLMQSETNSFTWKSQILQQIDSLSQKGVPGRIIVFGQDSEPILTGIGEEDVLVAAAEFGKGRIVCVAHDAYCENFQEDSGDLQKFHNNVKKWLTRGTFNSNGNIINAKQGADQQTLSTAKIIFWDGGPGNILSADMEEFVRNGGGLFHCMTPWGWLQLNDGKSLSDVPYYSLLLDAGICYTDEYIQVQDNQFSVENNKASGAHILRLMKEIEQHPEKTKEKMIVSSRKKFLPGAGLWNLMQSETNSFIWKSQILQQIDNLSQKGAPGRIIVFGQNSEPILTGVEEEDVLVAAAEFGKGRIVCVAHDAYCENFQEDSGDLQKFHNNVKKWLTRGTFNSNANIINAKHGADQQTLSTAKIIFWDGGPGNILSTHMEEFVRNGGGLFHCTTPWGWLQLNDGKSLSDVPYYNLLLDAGICYTDEYIQVQDNQFSVKNNKANGAHILKILKEIEQHPQKIDQFIVMLKRLKYLPRNILLHFQSTIEKLWKDINDELKEGNIPKPDKAISSKRGIALLELWLVLLEILDPTNIKAPGVDIFPGDFRESPVLKSHEFEFNSDLEEFHSTACYLPAGKTLKLDIISGNSNKDWHVMIGCHTDVLHKDEIRRWPTVNKMVKITNNTHLISSAFGGLVYFISPNKANSKIKVKIDNITDSPHFKLIDGEEGRKVWQMSRGAPGLWADIEGDLIAFTLPSQSVRHLEFDKLFSTMKVWDSVVRLYHDLRGTDVSKFRRQWVVCDEQPSAGYMHSGYPIVTHLDVTDPKRADIFLLDGESLLKEGRWGIFHEIGHNMQRSMWTFDGTGEVTCNIFTLAAMDCICHLKPWIHSWLCNQIKDTEDFLKDGAQFETWKSNPGVALFIYAQLVHAFGWKSYKNVFHRYEAMTENEQPNADQEKIDSWFLTFSEVVGHNLAPLARFWGIGISVEMTKRLETAFSTAFLPDDEITKMSPKRVDKLFKQFPNLVRNVTNSVIRVHRNSHYRNFKRSVLCRELASNFGDKV